MLSFSGCPTMRQYNSKLKLLSIGASLQTTLVCCAELNLNDLINVQGSLTLNIVASSLDDLTEVRSTNLDICLVNMLPFLIDASNIAFLSDLMI